MYAEEVHHLEREAKLKNASGGYGIPKALGFRLVLDSVLVQLKATAGRPLGEKHYRKRTNQRR